MPFAVRPLRIQDPVEVAAVAALHQDIGWPTRDLAGWSWMAANPAVEDAPVGWVAVDGADRPVGVLGNLRLAVVGAGRRLIGATGFSVVTSRRGRGAGTALVRTFLGQPGTFAAWTFNANAAGAPLYGRLGMSAWPPETCGLKLSWIVDPLACAAGRALRAVAHDRRLYAPLGERLLSRNLDRRLPPLAEGLREITAFGPGSAWDGYRLRLGREPRLRPDRSPAVMAWRDSDPQRLRAAVMIGRFDGPDLVAHARVQAVKGNALEVTTLEILDLDWVEGHAGSVPALLGALFDLARARGHAKLRLQVVSPRVRQALGPWLPRARVEGGWGHCKIHWNGGLPDLPWEPTPFDGDYEVCLRPAPRARSVRLSGGPSARPGFPPAEPRSAWAPAAGSGPDRPPASAASS
jgi:hypothetical protein